MLVGSAHCPLDREGQPLDIVALQAEMRLAEAGGEPCAEDLQLSAFLGQPELHAVPVEARHPFPLARGNRRRAEATDALNHLREIMVSEHWNVPEQVVEAVRRFQI